MKQEKNKYSRIQYFLWLVAGSEISVLKKCPNDYNRHANIGLMIVITSLFAGITAFVAGVTFAPESQVGVFLFACVWAMLIFSLDRSMVNSIKKDPTQIEKSIWDYFAPRLVLAIILSFFMSIPLDHIVFKDNIETQLKINNQKFILNSNQNQATILNIKQDSVDSEQARKNAADAEKQNQNPCRIPEYIRKKNEAENLDKNELPKLAELVRINRNKLDSRMLKLWQNQTPDSIKVKVNAKLLKADYSKVKTKGDEEYQNLLAILESAKTKLKKTDDLVWQLRSEADKIYNQWHDQNEMKKINNTKKAEYLDSIKFLKQKQMDSLNVANQNFLREHNGFDVKFKTLFLIPDFAVQFLKWLIFLALLVIEILPTFLKLKTPMGQYDWEMYKADKETEIQSIARLEKFRIESSEIESYRKDQEVKMNKNLIDKVVSIEERLANEMLEEWEIKARNQMKNNVEKS